MTGAPEVHPRDDRAWPRASTPISLVLGLAAAGAGIGIAVAAADRGTTVLIVVVAGFVAAFGFGVVVYVAGIRRWLDGHPIPGGLKLLQFAGVAAAVLVLYVVDGAVGGAMLAGLIAGMLSANTWAIRAARANRGRVDEAETALAADQAAASHVPAHEPEEPGESAPVGQVLRETVALERQRLLAWLIAGGVALAACLVFDAPEPVVVGVIVMGGAALLWVARRLWGVWLALRDFTKAASSPRRAFVVLLHDPAPRMIRPLLGVWSEAPVVRGGRLPRPERVYRCDDEHDALECHQGSVVIHEAWVDTGTKPRWVAADAGIALPHRRSVFGRWYVSSLIGGERPGPPERLSLRPPHPATDALGDAAGGRGSFAVALGWRLAALAAAGLVFHWLA